MAVIKSGGCQIVFFSQIKDSGERHGLSIKISLRATAIHPTKEIHMRP
jgi:hypothetical protein